MDDMK